MSKEHEKTMSDLNRLLAGQQFESIDDANAFLKQLMGKPIPTYPTEARTDAEKAQDLIFEAYQLEPEAGKLKAKEALDLDPQCIEAFEYLGDVDPQVEPSLLYYEMGVQIGRLKFGGEFMRKNKGMFWGLHETRPFMRCLFQSAECLYVMGQKEQTLKIFEEMIELNPQDNQGVRDQLLLYYIEMDKDAKFKKYAKMYKDDWMAGCIFTRALYAFKTEGDSVGAVKKLNEAIGLNSFVAPMILSSYALPTLPETYSPGHEDEAICYAAEAREIWKKVPGATDWLNKRSKSIKTV